MLKISISLHLQPIFSRRFRQTIRVITLKMLKLMNFKSDKRLLTKPLAPNALNIYFFFILNYLNFTTSVKFCMCFCNVGIAPLYFMQYPERLSFLFITNTSF